MPEDLVADLMTFVRDDVAMTDDDLTVDTDLLLGGVVDTRLLALLSGRTPYSNASVETLSIPDQTLVVDHAGSRCFLRLHRSATLGFVICEPKSLASGVRANSTYH